MSTLPNDFHRRTRDARKIIVVDLGFLGDSIHLIPTLWEIKRNYPQAELHTLSAPLGAEVMALTPCVDRAWTFPLGPHSPAWWRHWNVIRAIRRERFDVAFNFSGADRSIFLTALTGARWRVAHAAGRRHFWNRWLVPTWVTRQSRDLPVLEQKRQVLAACGLTLAAPRFELAIPAADQAWAESQIPSGAIHFSINASTALKEWPLERWVELVRLLPGANTRLLASGSSRPREQQRLGQFAAAADTRLQLLPATLTVAQLAAVLRRCQVHVGADSGVLHLAMAAGTPTVAIFRQYAGLAEWLPRGPEHHHVTAPCPCADQPEPPCAATGRAACLASIDAATVAALVEAAAKKHQP